MISLGFFPDLYADFTKILLPVSTGELIHAFLILRCLIRFSGFFKLRFAQWFSFWTATHLGPTPQNKCDFLFKWIHSHLKEASRAKWTTFAQGLQENSSHVFAGSLGSSFKVKFLCKQSQRHHGGFTMALLCWFQAGLKKPLGGTVSLEVWNRRVIVELWGSDCSQGFAAVKNLCSEGKRPLHRAAWYPESCSKQKERKCYASRKRKKKKSRFYFWLWS